MSLDDSLKVDAIGIDEGSGSVVLSILDSWAWRETLPHLAALQEKLNAYFDFIESGQLYESYPLAVGRSLTIDIVTRFPMPPEGVVLLEKASEVADELGVNVESRHLPDHQGN